MKICTWGDVVSAIEGKTTGGGELQIALLAKTLAKSGHEVAVIDIMTKRDFVTNDGVKIFQIKGYDKGIRIFRFFTRRLPKIYKSLKDQKADICYCQIRNFTHILAYWAARKTKGIFVLQLASDLDALGLKERIKHDYSTHYEGLYWFLKVFLTELIFPRLVRKADIVLVQHEGQKNALLKKGINSIIFNNLIELGEIPQVLDHDRHDFSYVGALDKRKGFAQFYELVVKAPFATFKVIGGPRDRTGYKYYEKLKSFKNVTLFGYLNHSQTLTHILNSKALISTSPMEGFPNIFVEAWACGIPVFSLSFDPGGVIRKERLGEVADGNIDKLVNDMFTIKNTDEFAKRSRAYVERNHLLNADKINEINDLFTSMVEKKNLKRLNGHFK
jgi:glycosyltransferase involved in cell wall biosynthesis